MVEKDNWLYSVKQYVIQGRIKQAGGSWDVPVMGNWYADKFIKYT